MYIWPVTEEQHEPAARRVKALKGQTDCNHRAGHASVNTLQLLHCMSGKRIAGTCCTARTHASFLQCTASIKTVQQVPEGWGQGVCLPSASRWPVQRLVQLEETKVWPLCRHIPSQPSLQVADQRSQLHWCKLDLFSPSCTQIQATDDRRHARSCYLWGAA